MSYFHPYLSEDSHFDYYFSIRLKPPTTNIEQYIVISCRICFRLVGLNSRVSCFMSEIYMTLFMLTLYFFVCTNVWFVLLVRSGFLKLFSFTTILGEIIQFYLYFSSGLKPPTSFWFIIYKTMKGYLIVFKGMCTILYKTLIKQSYESICNPVSTIDVHWGHLKWINLGWKTLSICPCSWGLLYRANIFMFTSSYIIPKMKKTNLNQKHQKHPIPPVLLSSKVAAWKHRKVPFLRQLDCRL